MSFLVIFIDPSETTGHTSSSEHFFSDHESVLSVFIRGAVFVGFSLC